jgi:glycosyltransferase involved in cell wall biosynthesis
MWPSAAEPDFGSFVAQVCRELERQGHELEVVAIDRRGLPRTKYLRLLRDARRAAKRFAPDVVYAHFLVPTGFLAGFTSRAPLVLTTHGQDVANVGSIPGVRAATTAAVKRASAVIAVSDYLRRELEAKVPAARGKTCVVDCGVDTERFRPSPPPAGPPAYLCLGSLTERKNVVRLADAFATLDEGSLTFAGDGPLRPQLEGRDRVRLLGPVRPDEVPALVASSHVVCQPSLVEPFGQALLEALASGRPIVATNVGGPPEFVPPEAGILVDPTDEAAIAAALQAAAALPSPNQAARAAAEAHDVNEQARRVEEILEAARDRRA